MSGCLCQHGNAHCGGCACCPEDRIVDRPPAERTVTSVFFCPGANAPDTWPYKPAKWCPPAGVCPDCGRLSCAAHGCQFDPGHAPVKAAS